jgi:crotonobetainyl-CoA:carnitine CoA-transferase CaiB-like acyl-CoA transferase
LRVANRAALTAALEPVFAARPAIWWLRALQRHRVPCGLAHHFETFRHHQQVVDNDMIARLATRDWGEVSVAGVPWHFSQTPCTVREPARPGEHTDQVMQELAARPRNTIKGAA